MITLVLNKNLKDKKKAVYAFYYLAECLNDDINVSFHSDKNALNVYYNVKPDTEEGIFIPYFKDNNRLSFNNHRSFTYPCFEGELEKPYTINGKIITFNYDIISASFYLISCEEEYENNRRDSIDRFLSEYSQRKNSIQVPLFDNNSKILAETLLVLNSELNQKKNNFQIYLTHDIDNVDSRNRYIFMHNAKELVLNRNISFTQQLAKLIRQSLTNQFRNISKYMELERQYGAKSEFYFIQGKKHRYGSRYKLSQAYEDLELIKSSNEFVIGMHTNFFSYDDEKEIAKEKREIEDYCGVKVKSCRNHYLRFKVPYTWEKLKNSGIQFDTTLGYSDKNGFRAATSKSFIPFNINKDNIIDIYEIPLLIMDVAVMDKNKTLEEKWDEIKILLNQAQQSNGTVSIIWHEDVLADRTYKEMYEKILNYVKSGNGIFVTHRDLESRFLKQKNELYRLFQAVRQS